MPVNRSGKLYKRRNNRRKMNTKRKVRKITKRKVRKITKRKVRKNTNRKNIRKSSKNKIRHKRGGAEPPEVVSTESINSPVVPEIMNRSIVEISDEDGSIIKDTKKSETFTVVWSSEEVMVPAGISINFLDNSRKQEHVLLKVCKHGVDGINKELTVGKDIGGIEGLIKPITLGYLGLVEAGNSDENLPAMIDRPEWSDKITWIESPRYYVMYKYIDGLSLLDFYNQILADNYDSNTLYINRIISVIILDILYALRNIHGRGWVHNDLSLENIMITGYEGIRGLAYGDYTKRPTITIIDLDACEECARTNTCMEIQGPRVGFPKAREEALTYGIGFNGRLSDICSVGNAFNRIFENLSENLSEYFSDKSYSVNDEVVKKLMEEMNYGRVEDAIILTHQYITNNKLFPNGTYKKSDASAEAGKLLVLPSLALRPYKRWHLSRSLTPSTSSQTFSPGFVDGLRARVTAAASELESAVHSPNISTKVLEQLKKDYMEAEGLLTKAIEVEQAEKLQVLPSPVDAPPTGIEAEQAEALQVLPSPVDAPPTGIEAEQAEALHVLPSPVDAPPTGIEAEQAEAEQAEAEQAEELHVLPSPVDAPPTGIEALRAKYDDVGHALVRASRTPNISNEVLDQLKKDYMEAERLLYEAQNPDEVDYSSDEDNI